MEHPGKVKLLEKENRGIRRKGKDQRITKRVKEIRQIQRSRHVIMGR